MYDVELRHERRERVENGLIDSLGSLRATHDEDRRHRRVELEEGVSALLRGLQYLLADRVTNDRDAVVDLFGKFGRCRRMCDGNPARELCRPERDAAGRSISVVDNDGYAQETCRKKRRKRGVSARGENDVGIDTEKLRGRTDNAYGIGKYTQYVEQAGIAADLTCGTRHIGDVVLKQGFCIKSGRSDVEKLGLDKLALIADVLNSFGDSNKRVEMPARSPAYKHDTHCPILSQNSFMDAPSFFLYHA